MAKSILGVIAGYIVMVILVIITSTAAAKILVPDNTTPTVAYLAVNLMFGLIAAVVGGHVTAAIAKQGNLKPVYALMVLIFILGVVSLGAMANNQPSWYPYVLLIIGPLGAYLGGYQYLSHKK